MNSFCCILQRKPLIGAGTSIGSGVLGLSFQTDVALLITRNSTMETLTPYLSFIALGIGITVGILTCILKIMEIREQRKKKKEKKDVHRIR